jgi:general secretion pathway protein D
MGSYRRRSGLTAACGLLALGGLTASVPAYSAPDTGQTVSIDVVGADLHAVVNQLEQQAHVDAMVRDGDTPFKPVNVHLDQAGLAKALRTIASSAGARVSVNSDGVYVFESDSDGSGASLPETPAPADSSQPAPVQYADNNPEAGFAEGSLHYQTIVLQHAVPSDILKLMHWDRDEVDMDPFKPVQMPQAVPSVSSTQQSMTQPNMNPQAMSPAYSNGYPSVPMGTGNPDSAGANYSAHRSAEADSPDQVNQFGGGRGGRGGGGGGFGGGGGGFGGGGGNGFNGGGGQNPFQTGANPFAAQPFQPGGRPGQQQAPLPDGVARIFALQSNNSLLVEATPAGYQLVRQIVKILDVAPRQVEIKVEFVTASVTDVDALGVNFDLVPYPGLEIASGQGSGSFGGTISGLEPTFLQYATGNVVAQLFQTLTRTRGKVVQAPMITTTNNVTATIQVNTQIPFFTTGVTSNGGVAGGTTQSTQANFLTLTTGLTITPRINSDDTVTMNLAPQITDTTGQPSVGGIPPTVQQTLTTLRTVHSGETMVLGGLVRKQESASSQRIPILSDIPFFGGLFRTRNKQVNDQELLIFVTPTIISDSNDSGTSNADSGQNITVTP